MRWSRDPEDSRGKASTKADRSIWHMSSCPALDQRQTHEQERHLIGTGSTPDTLQDQYPYLSPLDAFKAKGRYLHDQLERERLEHTELADAMHQGDSPSRGDAFAYDYELQSRKSKVATFAERKHFSILSEMATVEDVSTQYIPEANSQLDDRKCEGAFAAPRTCHYKGDPGRNLYKADGRSPDSTDSCGSRKSSYSKVSSSSPGAAFSEPSSRTRMARSASRPKPNRFEIAVLCEQTTCSTIRPSNIRSLTGSSLSPCTIEQVRITSQKLDDLQLEDERDGLGRLLESINFDRPSDVPVRNSLTPERRLLTNPSPSSDQKLQLNTPHKSPLLNRGNSVKPNKRSPSMRTPSLNTSNLASLPDAALSAITHVELGIEQHEENQLPQSTHHFKVAAEMGDLTGCLLYGLALRHGWGIRPDLQRSVQLLQQAADSANLKNLRTDDLRGSKLFTAPLNDQLGVAMYELAVSFKNGWGVAADKKMSLKYLEFACDLGDVEAMVEAAECYLNGNGCKKDKSKAAKLLRAAELKGKKEIGNSWIWKSKYDG